jgi:protein-disulfide isomerase
MNIEKTLNKILGADLSAGPTATRLALIRSAVALVLLGGLLGCGGDAGAAQAEENATVATVGGEQVSRVTLLERAEQQLENVDLERVQCIAGTQKKRHDVLEANLEGLVRDQLRDLAAAAAGKSPEEWIESERRQKAADVSAEQVDQLISANPRLARANRQQVEGQVRDYLAEEAIFAELKERFPVDYQLEPYRVEVAADGPAKGGGAEAPVTIVEFSDFQCPYCKRVLPALDEAVAKYGDKVRLVFRQFPLNSIHPQAQKAAEASLCAADQGKFWPMHDAMFAQQSKLSPEDLKATAQEVGLDARDFASCLDSGKHSAAVSADLKAGAGVGVTGTPALFINGRPMSGAVGFDTLAEVIDQELARGK